MSRRIHTHSFPVEIIVVLLTALYNDIMETSHTKLEIDKRVEENAELAKNQKTAYYFCRKMKAGYQALQLQIETQKEEEKKMKEKEREAQTLTVYWNSLKVAKVVIIKEKV